MASCRGRWRTPTWSASGNNAGLLFHNAPAGDSWIAETKLHLDTGSGDIRNYQQAGMIAYLNDDDFARLGNVAIWKTRQIEYGRELVARASDGATSYGGAAIGRSAPTQWMRLAYHQNAAGEHVYQAGTSVDGKHWTWGAAWVLSAPAKLGLFAHGEFTGANPRAGRHLRLPAVLREQVTCATVAAVRGVRYAGNFADPFVLRRPVGDRVFYAFATNGPLGNVQTLRSTDLQTWEPVGDALPTLPAWTTPGRVWAPEVVVHGPDRYSCTTPPSTEPPAAKQSVSPSPPPPKVPMSTNRFIP